MAFTVPRVPHPSSRVLDTVGLFVREWYNWFDDLQKAVSQRLPVSGTVTFSGGTSAAVTFSVAEPNANYNVLLDIPENKTAYVDTKAATGFVIHVPAGGTGAYGWTVIRR